MTVIPRHQLNNATAVRETNIYKNLVGLWEGGIKKNCARLNFGYVQFLDDEEDEKFGSMWQKIVCEQVGVIPEYTELFWQEKGRAAAKRSICNRRSNTSVAVGRRFKGK